MKNYLTITKTRYIIYGKLNPIINPKKGKFFSPVNKLIIDRNVIVDKQEISYSMNEHFCNIDIELQSEVPGYGHKYRDYMPQRITNLFIWSPLLVMI